MGAVFVGYYFSYDLDYETNWKILSYMEVKLVITDVYAQCGYNLNFEITCLIIKEGFKYFHSD